MNAIAALALTICALVWLMTSKPAEYGGDFLGVAFVFAILALALLLGVFALRALVAFARGQPPPGGP